MGVIMFITYNVNICMCTCIYIYIYIYTHMIACKYVCAVHFSVATQKFQSRGARQELPSHLPLGPRLRKILWI